MVRNRYEQSDLELLNKRFGRLIPIRRINETGRAVYECVCDCGNTFITLGVSIKHGHTNSCGCLRAENSKKAFTNVMDKGINKLKSARVDGTNLLTLNQKVRKNNSSGYKGVSYSKKYNNYRAYLNLSRKQIYLGSFATAEEAYQARLEGEKKYYQPLLKSHAQDMDQ